MGDPEPYEDGNVVCARECARPTNLLPGHARTVDKRNPLGGQWVGGGGAVVIGCRWVLYYIRR